MQRRRLLRVAGATSLLGLPTDFVTGHAGRSGTTGDCPRPQCIHPTLGYTGFSFDDLAALPSDLLPDHRIALVTRSPEAGDEERPDTQDAGGQDQLGPADAEPADRRIPEGHFDPTGLAVAAGDVVLFTADAPGHTVTTYHPRFGRQRRVPPGTAPASSPVLGDGWFWLYRFEQPGVYDLYSAPYEIFGAALRIVVGDGDAVTGDGEADVGPTGAGRRPPQLTAALVLDDRALAPEPIVDRGAVGWDDLAPGSKQRLVVFRDPLQGLVHRFDGVDTDATDPFELAGGVVVAVYEHEGRGRFTVELVATADAGPAHHVATESDVAAGVAAFGVEGGEYVLDVEAGGPWSVALAQPTASPDDVTDLPATVDGEGPDYAGPFRFEGLVRATATHHGAGTFLVRGFDERGGRAGGVVFDEDGRFQGQATFTYAGVAWIAVDAGGRWTVSFEHVS